MDTEQNANSHMLCILEARDVIIMDLSNTATVEALGEVVLEVPGMT